MASVSFVAGMDAFVAMGWLITRAAQAYALAIDHHGAYRLLAIASVPLSLSLAGRCCSRWHLRRRSRS